MSGAWQTLGNRKQEGCQYFVTFCEDGLPIAVTVQDGNQHLQITLKDKVKLSRNKIDSEDWAAFAAKPGLSFSYEL